MTNLLKSYWLRTKRTPVRVLMILAPILYSLIVCLYFFFSKTLKGQEVLSFYAMLAIISTFSLSILVPMVYDPDKIASHYANDLRIGIDRRRVFFTRFVFITLICLVIILLAVSFFILFLLVTNGEFKKIQVIILTVILLMTLMPMIAIYQYLSLRFNYTGSILVGCLITLAAILLGTTNLGERVWLFLPFTWPIKLTFEVGKGAMSLRIVSLVLIGTVLVIAITLWGLSLWYNKWDGVTRLEE